MANELKLGGTYKHYKTKGLYKALQVVKLLNNKDEPLDCYTHVLREVKYTGDGQYDGVMMELCYALNGGTLFVRHNSAPNVMLVLYFSHSAKDYFVRPLSEFVATVSSIHRPNETRVEDRIVPVPRFELQP